MSMPTRDQFAGCLVGQCLGDAAGFMVEGYPPDVCRVYVDEYLRNGRAREAWRDPYQFGQYTDDSQLARELLQSFVTCGHFDPADYAARIAALFEEDRVVGRGLATEQAARRLAAGVPWQSAGTPPPSAGNGSAMRAGPIGLLFWNAPQALVEAAHDQGRITHQDARCSAGAVAIAGAVAAVVQSDRIDAQQLAGELAERAFPFDRYLAHGLERLTYWVNLPPEEAVKQIATVGVLPDFRENLWEGISPFVTPSVLWSLYSFFRSPDDYWEAICTAIAVGGDVDTTAAMTGAIAGAQVGLAGLPPDLAACLNDNDSWRYEELVGLAYRSHEISLQTS